jgi:hypothetical protein
MWRPNWGSCPVSSYDRRLAANLGCKVLEKNIDVEILSVEKPRSEKQEWRRGER